jgi:hypothetical protein
MSVGNGPVSNTIPVSSTIPVSTIEDNISQGNPGQVVEQVGNTVPAQSTLPEVRDQAPIVPLTQRTLP